MQKQEQAGNVAELHKKIAESEKNQNLWQEFEEKYNKIVDLSPCGIVIVDLKGKVTSCNRAAAEITGFTEEEIIGKKFTRLPYLQRKDIPKYIKIFSSLLFAPSNTRYVATSLFTAAKSLTSSTRTRALWKLNMPPASNRTIKSKRTFFILGKQN